MCFVNRRPPPENPFEIDWAYLEGMTDRDRTLACAALLQFLRPVYLAGLPYSSNVLEDIEALAHMHHESMARSLG